MQRELALSRREVARRHGVRDRPVDLSARGERAAGVAVSLDPAGIEIEQPLVDQRRLVMVGTIAEQPGAEPGGLGVVRGGKGESAAAAFQSVVAPAAVKQDFRQPAVLRDAVRSGLVVAPQQRQASIEIPDVERPVEGSGGATEFEIWSILYNWNVLVGDATKW